MFCRVCNLGHILNSSSHHAGLENIRFVRSNMEIVDARRGHTNQLHYFIMFRFWHEVHRLKANDGHISIHKFHPAVMRNEIFMQGIHVALQGIHRHRVQSGDPSELINTSCLDNGCSALPLSELHHFFGHQLLGCTVRRARSVGQHTVLVDTASTSFELAQSANTPLCSTQRPPTSGQLSRLTHRLIRPSVHHWLTHYGPPWCQSNQRKKCSTL